MKDFIKMSSLELLNSTIESMQMLYDKPLSIEFFNDNNKASVKLLYGEECILEKGATRHEEEKDYDIEEHVCRTMIQDLIMGGIFSILFNMGIQ